MEVSKMIRARQNVYKMIRKVDVNHTSVYISSKDGDCIRISADDWKAILET